MKDCGVVVAIPQGHSWAPPLSNGTTANVGTLQAAPSPVRTLRAGGKARRRLRSPGGGGGVVVVSGRESRPQGEGPHRVRSSDADHGGRG
jgi:hypothetical protein